MAGNPFVGTSGAISMCVQPGTNELHALRRGDRCPSGYAALTLTQGKRGERGRRGARGPAGPAGARGPTGPAGGAGFTVYQGDVKNQSIVLGPQSSPTHIVDTPQLPIGTYFVSYSVGFVLGRLDNAVCAAAPASTPHGNDGVFGVGGNGATESGTGAAGIYGNGVAFDTIRITQPHDRISIYCNSANENGTYVGGATIIAIPAQTLVIDHQ